MPQLILNVTTQVANRLATAAVSENPSLSGATANEKAEYVRNKVIRLLKDWVVKTEKDELKKSTENQIMQLRAELQQLEQTVINNPDIT